MFIYQPESLVARIRDKLGRMFRTPHHECTDCKVGNRCILSFLAYTSSKRALLCCAMPFFVPSGFHVSSPYLLKNGKNFVTFCFYGEWVSNMKHNSRFPPQRLAQKGISPTHGLVPCFEIERFVECAAVRPRYLRVAQPSNPIDRQQQCRSGRQAECKSHRLNPSTRLYLDADKSALS